MLKCNIYCNLLVVVQSKHSVVVAGEKNLFNNIYFNFYLTYAEHTHRYPSLAGQKNQNP